VYSCGYLFSLKYTHHLQKGQIKTRKRLFRLRQKFAAVFSFQKMYPLSLFQKLYPKIYKGNARI